MSAKYRIHQPTYSKVIIEVLVVGIVVMGTKHGVARVGSSSLKEGIRMPEVGVIGCKRRGERQREGREGERESF